MKPLALAAAVLVCSCASAPARMEARDAVDAAGIPEFYQRYAFALRAHQRDSLAGFYHPDGATLVINGTRMQETGAQLDAAYRTQWQGPAFFAFDSLRFRSLDASHATATGRFRWLPPSSTDTLRFIYLAILERTSAGWRMVLEHETQEPTPAAPTILFLSDFGVKDGAVAVCKGVMLGIAPTARIVDLTHDIPAYDIETAAEVLAQAVPFYKEGTVTVAVVDPGVGSERRSIAVRTKKGHLLVGPDNGIFTLLLDAEGLDGAVELRNARYFLRPRESFTFHGRDVFSPVAAHLAAGVPLDSLGPAITPVRLSVQRARRVGGTVEGTVRYVEDPYGNVVTDITPALLDSAGLRVGDTLSVTIGDRELVLPWRNTFSDVASGAPLAVMHSRALLSFSINMGSFAQRYGVERKARVTVQRRRP